jgi:hypothetical protein
MVAPTSEQLASVKRLWARAQECDGTAKRVAGFLLSLYNGERFPYSLTDFRMLDTRLYADCMVVLSMDYLPQQAEVHVVLGVPGTQFERLLAEKFRIPDVTRLVPRGKAA